MTFLKENAIQRLFSRHRGNLRITTIVKSMKKSCYRDAESREKAQRSKSSYKSTIVVATNEWKYHAEVITDLDDNLPMVPCNIGEINKLY